MKQLWNFRNLVVTLGISLLVSCGMGGSPQPPVSSGDAPAVTADSSVLVADENGNEFQAQALPTNGLTGTYFDNADFTGIQKTRVDSTINSSWGKGSPVTGIQPTSYSVRWMGQIQPQTDQEYTFSLTHSDGAKLMINGIVLVNNWKDQEKLIDNGKITLKGGVKYDIRLEYYHNSANPANLKLEWSGKVQKKQIIPSSVLTINLGTPTIPTGARAVPFSVNSSELPEGASIMGPLGRVDELFAGTLIVPKETNNVIPIFLLDEKGNTIGMDSLVPGKTSLEFNYINTAKTALSASGGFAFLMSDARIKVYNQIPQLPEFNTYLSLLGSKRGFKNVDLAELDKMQQTIYKKLFQTASGSKIQSLSVKQQFDWSTLLFAMHPAPDPLTAQVDNRSILKYYGFLFEGDNVHPTMQQLDNINLNSNTEVKARLGSPTPFTGIAWIDNTWQLAVPQTAFIKLPYRCKTYTIVMSATTVGDAESPGYFNWIVSLQSIANIIGVQIDEGLLKSALLSKSTLVQLTNIGISISDNIQSKNGNFDGNALVTDLLTLRTDLNQLGVLIEKNEADNIASKAFASYMSRQIGLAVGDAARANFLANLIYQFPNILYIGKLAVSTIAERTDNNFPFAVIAPEPKSILVNNPDDVILNVPDSKLTVGLLENDSCDTLHYRVEYIPAPALQGLISLEKPTGDVTLEPASSQLGSQTNPASFIFKVNCSRFAEGDVLYNIIDLSNPLILGSLLSTNKFHVKCGAIPKLTGPTFAPDPITTFIGSDAIGTLTFGNAGGADLIWTATTDIGNLAIYSGTIGAIGTATNTPANIAYTYPCPIGGTFTDTITISSNDPVNSPKSVVANIVCKPKLPKIQVSTDYMLIKADVGQSAIGSFTIKNVGSANLKWDVRGGINMTSPSISLVNNTTYTLEPNESIQIDADSLCNYAGTTKSKWGVYNITIDSNDATDLVHKINVDKSCKGWVKFGGSQFGDYFQAPDGSYTNVFLRGYGCGIIDYSIDVYQVSVKWFANLNIEGSLTGGNSKLGYETGCIHHPSTEAGDAVFGQYQGWLSHAVNEAFDAIKNTPQNPNSSVEYTYLGSPSMGCPGGCGSSVQPVDFYSMVE